MREGLYAEEIHAGTLVDGRRVESMSRGLRDGRQTVTLHFVERNRKGRKRLVKGGTYPLGTRTVVPGTATPTTWAMTAGPVHLEPGREQRQETGTKLNGGWWGDGDANDRNDRADRHQRRIESITYR